MTKDNIIELIQNSLDSDGCEFTRENFSANNIYEIMIDNGLMFFMKCKRCDGPVNIKFPWEHVCKSLQKLEEQKDE